MTQQHPVTPPPKLVEKWIREANHNEPMFAQVAVMGAKWGADQELEACCEWLGDAPVVYNDNDELHPGSYLRDARRPKPPSLKEQALALLKVMQNRINQLHTVYPNIPHGWVADQVEFDRLYRALEALND